MAEVRYNGVKLDEAGKRKLEKRYKGYYTIPRRKKLTGQEEEKSPRLEHD